MAGNSTPLLIAVMEKLRGIDPKFPPTDAGYAEHVLLLASAREGAKEEHLARELGYDLEFVKTVGSRLRNSGVWIGDQLSEEALKEWQTHGTAFFVDGAVATGDLVVIGRSKDGRQFQTTDAGLARGAALIKEMAKTPLVRKLRKNYPRRNKP